VTTTDCPKCRSRMEEGFIQDTTDHQVKTSRWIEGKPESSFFSGVKTKGKRNFEVVTYRCSRCGYLEEYAR
jgi:predicted nucleic-acid-binding Zn-ribbon protein